MSLKRVLAAWLANEGHAIVDLGAHDDTSVDYPAYGFALATALADGHADRGIALCGSGIGIAIAANRHPACRCAHNDANAIAIGARLVGEDMAKACVAAFLSAEFLGGRHQTRVDMLSHAPSPVDVSSTLSSAIVTSSTKEPA